MKPTLIAIVGPTIFRGGAHRVVHNGDGFHYWIWDDDGLAHTKEPCSKWIGGCPYRAKVKAARKTITAEEQT